VKDRDRVDPDGVRLVARADGRRVRLLAVGSMIAAAAVVLASAVAVLVIRREGPGAARVPAEEPARIAATPIVPPRPSAARPVVIARGAAGDASGTPATAAPRDRGPAPATTRPDATRDAASPPPVPDPAGRDGALTNLARDLVENLRATGATGGIAVFPPKGTDPIKVGIVVPDDYELPEGYVRYHQVTDDGRRLPPILLFSPDYQFVDADGRAAALPKDGVVPPEMAPPGLPVRMLEIPEAARTAGSGAR
jgi:hypothetical protein